MTLKEIEQALDQAAKLHGDAEDEPEGARTCQFSLKLTREMRDSLSTVRNEVRGAIEIALEEIAKGML